MLNTLIIIVLVLAVIGAIPAWPYSRGWGYGPSGIGLVLAIFLILLLLGRI